MVVHPPPFAGGLKQSGQARNISNGRRQCLHAGGFWGAHTGPNPTDRAKKGCKRHVLTDANGIPLVVQTGPANQRDDHRLLPLLIDFPILPGPTAGRPRTKPVSVQADAGYGFPVLINLLRWLGITPLLKPRGTCASHRHGTSWHPTTTATAPRFPPLVPHSFSRAADEDAAGERGIKGVEAVLGIGQRQTALAIKDAHVWSASGPGARDDVGMALAIYIGDGHGAAAVEGRGVGKEVIQDARW